MLKLDIKTDKFFGTGLGKKYISNFKEKLFQATESGMKNIIGDITDKIRSDASSNLKIKRQAVIKSFTGKVYSKKKNTLPMMHFYSRVPWMGTHDKGAAISGKLFIPFVMKPLGYKTQKEIFEQLRRNRNLFTDYSGRQTILWAKNTKGDSKVLAPFKRLESSARKQRKQSGEKVRTTFKQEERVNIGILVKSTKLPKRLNFTTIIERNMNNIVKEIEKEFKD